MELPRPTAPGARAWRALVSLAAVAALSACPDALPDGTPGADATPDANADVVSTSDVTPGPDPTAGVTRLLSRVELERTLEALTGVHPAALDLLPPDSLGYSFDRIVASQTMSRARLDATFEIATEVADTLIGERRLDDVASACDDAIVPPLQGSETATVIGASLGLGPDWSVQADDSEPSWIRTVYAPDPTAGYAHGFPAPGRYRIELDVDIYGPVDVLDVDIGGEPAHTATDLDGQVTVSFEHDVAAEGTHVIEFRFQTEPDFHNLAITYQELRIEGPLDPGAQTQGPARRACAEAIVDELGPRAFRRPVTPAQRDELLGLYDQGEGAVGFRMLLQGILMNPYFLYAVEVGTPVDGAPGTFELDPWEVAARLSYALCEMPPDAELRAAAEANELQTPAQLEAQALRLLGQPCARDTIVRFLEHWLWLNHLDGINKSPDAFPAFDDATREGLMSEAGVTLEEMVFTEQADLELLFSADYGWPDPRSAWLQGLEVTTQQKTPLPPERRGILTSPGVMTATAPFETTSPVERGVFVLRQLLCVKLTPPPAELMVAPPPPDPNLTTRERWAQHSNHEDCKGCHWQLDPVGFALEGFDGVGKFRTEENGKPVDTQGGLPSLGIADGELSGGAELAVALASSDQLAECFALQWLRFALGRLENAADTPSAEAVAAVLKERSIREGLLKLVTTETFTRRYEAPEEDTP